MPEIKITKERVLAAAKESPASVATLKTLFPEAWEGLPVMEDYELVLHSHGGGFADIHLKKKGEGGMGVGWIEMDDADRPAVKWGGSQISNRQGISLTTQGGCLGFHFAGGTSKDD